MRQTFLSPFICLLLVLSFVSLTACQKNNAPSHNSEKSKEIYASDESIHIPLSPIFLYQNCYYGTMSFGDPAMKLLPVDAVLFCIYQDMIYYIPQSNEDEATGLWKANLDGTHPEKVTEKVSAWGSPTIIAGKIYSSYFASEGKEAAGVYVTDLNTLEDRKISESPWLIYGYNSSYIYYHPSDNTGHAGIFRSKLNGKEETFLLDTEEQTLSNIVVYHDSLYFSRKNEEVYEICRMDINTQEEIVLKNNLSDGRFDIAEGRLYYSVGDGVEILDFENETNLPAEIVYGQKTETARMLILKNKVYWIN